MCVCVCGGVVWVCVVGCGCVGGVWVAATEVAAASAHQLDSVTCTEDAYSLLFGILSFFSDIRFSINIGLRGKKL